MHELPERLMRLVELYGDDDVLDEGEPSLTAAVKHIPTGRVYPGRPGEAHWDVAKRNGFSGVDWKKNPDLQTGFYNHKGHFLDRKRALAYAVQHDLVHPMALKYLATPDAPDELGASFIKRPPPSEAG